MQNIHCEISPVNAGILMAVRQQRNSGANANAYLATAKNARQWSTDKNVDYTLRCLHKKYGFDTEFLI